LIAIGYGQNWDIMFKNIYIPSEHSFKSAGKVDCDSIDVDELDVSTLTMAGEEVTSFISTRIDIGTGDGDATRITYYNDLITADGSVPSVSVIDTAITAIGEIEVKNDTLIYKPASADTAALKGKELGVIIVN